MQFGGHLSPIGRSVLMIYAVFHGSHCTIFCLRSFRTHARLLTRVDGPLKGQGSRASSCDCLKTLPVGKTLIIQSIVIIAFILLSTACHFLSPAAEPPINPLLDGLTEGTTACGDADTGSCESRKDAHGGWWHRGGVRLLWREGNLAAGTLRGGN